MTVFRQAPIAATLLIASCGGNSAPPSPQPEPSPPPAAVSYERLIIDGEDVGADYFDPSLEYPKGSLTGWLAYTDVEGDAAPIGPFHHTNIARTDDGGQSWRLVTRANVSVAASITEPDGSVLQGAWAYEVPALVHTPDDPTSSWKLFTHRYLWTEAERQVAYGWISLATADDPAGPWSAEEALLGTAFTPFAPFTTRISIADLDPSLSDIIVITEPGVLYTDGVLYLSLSGLFPDGVDRIFLLASDDFGGTWRYVGDLITKADAEALGAARYDGSSLVEVMGEVFLLASPERNGLLHDGTSVFQFDDLASAALNRRDGRLVEYNHIPIQTEGFEGQTIGGGQADYDEGNVLRGVLFPQIDQDNKPGPVAQIYQTGDDLDD